jgi:lysophospholipase L1-like esterase
MPPHLTVRHLELCRKAVVAIRPGIPVVAILPPPHRAADYGYVHSGRAAADRATRAWAAERGVALLDLPALVGVHVLSGRGNPDGMHWGWAGHAAVGRACADVLGSLLRT